MEESVKYFVPNISDIRVGYECEIRKEPGIWKQEIISFEGQTSFSYWKERLELEWLRVPYLTKEQIEKEGWKVEIQILGKYMRGIKKCLVKQDRMGSNWDYDIPVEFQLTYDIKNYILKLMYITSLDDLTWFEGECKDINTFRYICKLLGI